MANWKKCHQARAVTAINSKCCHIYTYTHTYIHIYIYTYTCVCMFCQYEFHRPWYKRGQNCWGLHSNKREREYIIFIYIYTYIYIYIVLYALTTCANIVCWIRWRVPTASKYVVRVVRGTF